jgi:hypothetical protein
MITPHAVAAARCAGTWQQRWNCGWKTSPGVGQAGYAFGHTLVPALIVLLVVILAVRVAKKRKKGRSAAPAGVGR